VDASGAGIWAKHKGRRMLDAKEEVFLARNAHWVIREARYIGTKGK
jgi:hypothetical protein